MNPRTPTGQAPEAVEYIDWEKYKRYVYGKYRPTWAVSVFAYSRKYAHLIRNPRDIDTIRSTIKTNVIKSLRILAKYLGVYKDFKERCEDFGIKIKRANALSSFIRIFNNSNNDVLEWYKKASKCLDPNQKLYLRLVFSIPYLSKSISSHLCKIYFSPILAR